MIKPTHLYFMVLFALILLFDLQLTIATEMNTKEQSELIQAQVVLTVSESKR